MIESNRALIGTILVSMFICNQQLQYGFPFCLAVDKIGRGAGVGDQWVKPGDWELGDHVNEVCCFDSKLEWLKVCWKFEDAFFCGLLQWCDFLIASLRPSLVY